MKKIGLFLICIFIITGCTTQNAAPIEPIPPVQSVKPTKPSIDTTTSATSNRDSQTSATDDDYIDPAHVALTPDDIKKIVTDEEPTAVIKDIDLDDDYNRIVYEFDVHYNNQSYDVKIDANTGEIITWTLDN